jgi:hypothetical protein
VLLGACGGKTPEPPEPTQQLSIAGGRTLSPIDEASKDPSFVEFRRALLEAVDRRDIAHVVGVLDPAIKNSFGGDGGIDEFKQTWKPESPGSELWKELGFVLRHGGAFQDGNFVAPYFFSSFPDLHDLPGYDEDSFRYGAVIQEKVVLRTKPAESAPGVALLSFHVVKQLDDDSVPSGWMKAATTDGTEGYIQTAMWRNVVDYRAAFTKASGMWRMNMLLAGD